MTLLEAFSSLDGSHEPGGCTITVIGTWDALIAAIREPFLSQLTGPEWTFHDPQGNVQGTPYDMAVANRSRKHWLPEDEDSVALAWVQPNGTLKRVMCMTRESADTLRINVTFGKLQDTNHLHELWWDLGIRIIKQYVHTEKQLGKMMQRGDDDSTRWEYAPKPERPLSTLGNIYDLTGYLLKRPTRQLNYDYRPGDPRWNDQAALEALYRGAR